MSSDLILPLVAGGGVAVGVVARAAFVKWRTKRDASLIAFNEEIQKLTPAWIGYPATVVPSPFATTTELIALSDFHYGPDDEDVVRMGLLYPASHPAVRKFPTRFAHPRSNP